MFFRRLQSSMLLQKLNRIAFYRIKIPTVSDDQMQVPLLNSRHIKITSLSEYRARSDL